MSRIVVFLTTLTVVSLSSLHAGPIVWDGPRVVFVKADGSTLQDCITASVCLTRGDTGGLFNASESAYEMGVSPADTQWALGDLANWSDPSLTWSDWRSAVNADPRAAVAQGQDFIVHLVSDDIYLRVKFLSWTSGSTEPPPCGENCVTSLAPTGGFGYERSSFNPTSVDGAPEPATYFLMTTGLAAFFALRRRQR